MGISFMNEEIEHQNFKAALGLLVGKPLPVKTSWTVSDVIEWVNAQAKKCAAQRVDLGKKYEIKDKTPLSSLPAGVQKEFTDLDEMVVEMPVEPFTLPVKDAAGREIWYEPVIFSALRKLIKREE